MNGRDVTGRPGVDGIVVPTLLALVAFDLVSFDPPRALAWRWLHDTHLTEHAPAWLRALGPHPTPGWDRDPVAAALAFFMLLLGGTYIALSRFGAGPRSRAIVLTAATFLLVVLPSLAFIEMGWIANRPYGQDGGVVQLPLAIGKILQGESPYGADYSDSILGKEARASGFWAGIGRNPILHHHAYLPGTHLLMLPAYAASRAAGVAFDPRIVTLAAFLLAIALAAWIPGETPARLAAAACVAVNPLVYWHQIFGANDILVVLLLLAAVACVARGRSMWGAVLLGLACATKQLAWPFAPFVLVSLAGIRSFSDLKEPMARGRLLRTAAVVIAVFVVVVAPVAALDFRSFWGDIVAYNVGLPGADNYPLGGTPGFGFANFLIYFGAVSGLADYFPFGIFYLLFVPLGLFLVHRQWKVGQGAAPLVLGSCALLGSVYFSRVVHPNYLVLLATLLPVGVVASRRFTADTAVVPLALLASAVAVVGGEVYATSWQDAVVSRLPQWISGVPAALLPRARPHLTVDPLGLGLGASAAGLGLVYLVCAIGGVSARWRSAVIVVGALGLVVAPTLFLERVARGTGTVRALDPWAAEIAGGANPVREAWSRSFQNDPPALLEATRSGTRLGRTPLDRVTAATAKLWAGSSPIVDPRPMVLAGLALGALLLWRASPAECAPLVLGAALLSPFTVVGVPFGSGEWIFAVAMLVAFGAGRVVQRAALIAVSVGGLLWGLSGARPPEADLSALFGYSGLSASERLLCVTLAAVPLFAALVFALRPRVTLVRSLAWDRLFPVVLLWSIVVLTPGASVLGVLTPLLLLLLQYVSPPNAGVVELADTHV